MAEAAPRLWSDFDGTAVGLVKKSNPRNLSKYPLPAKAGYGDFMIGVASTGVEIAGVVSRRPNIFVRRFVTARSIAKLGYGEFLPEVIHTGSEQAKGNFLLYQSRRGTIGMIEDNPHKLGAVLVASVKQPERLKTPRHPIVLGVVHHEKSQRYIDMLGNVAEAIGELSVQETGPMTAIGLTIRGEGLALDVVQLEPYGRYVGQAFGQRLLDTDLNLAA